MLTLLTFLIDILTQTVYPEGAVVPVHWGPICDLLKLTYLGMADDASTDWQYRHCTQHNGNMCQEWLTFYFNIVNRFLNRVGSCHYDIVTVVGDCRIPEIIGEAVAIQNAARLLFQSSHPAQEIDVSLCMEGCSAVWKHHS